MKKLGLLATVMAAIAFSTAPALAVVEKTKRDTGRNDATTGSVGTTIAWDTGFRELNYVCTKAGGKCTAVIQLNVDFEVSVGLATFFDVTFRKKGRCCSKGVTASIDDVDGGVAVHTTHFDGTTGGAIGHVDDRVQVDIIVETLKCGSSGIAKGKVHLKANYFIDRDDVGGVDTKTTGYGFNLQVRDPPPGFCT